MLVELHRCDESRCEAVRKLVSLVFATNMCLDHDKFVTAEPGYHIIAAHRCAQSLGDRLEQEIAAFVAQGVIDAFEMVDVEEMYGKTVTFRRRRSERVAQFLDQVNAVGQTGQGVMVRKEADAAVGNLLLLRAAVPRNRRNDESQSGNQTEPRSLDQERAVKIVALLRLVDVSGDSGNGSIVDDNWDVSLRVNNGKSGA